MEDCENDCTYTGDEDEQECEIEEEGVEDYPTFCSGFGHGMPGRRGRHRHGPPSARHGPMCGQFGLGAGHPPPPPHWGLHTRGHPPYKHGRHHPHPHGPPAPAPHGPAPPPHGTPGNPPHRPPSQHTHGPPHPHQHGPPRHHPHGPPVHPPPHGPPLPMFGAFRRGGRGQGKFISRRSCRWCAGKEEPPLSCYKTGSTFPGSECGPDGGKQADDIYVYVHDFAPEELNVKISKGILTVTAEHTRQQADDIAEPRRENMAHVYQLPTDEKIDRLRVKAKLVCRGVFLRIKIPYKKVQVPIERDDDPLSEMDDELVIEQD